MSYQAVIRNSGGALVTNQAVGVKISILQGSPSGTLIYQEIYNPNPQTNENGLLALEIGGGIPLTGTFSTIDWASGPYFFKTETDPTGGTSLTITGTSQLLSVPYSLHAKTAESITGTITETDPVFGESVANGIKGVDIDNWNNKLDTEVDGSVTNEIQTLSITGNDLSIVGGNTVLLPAKVTIVSNAVDASIVTSMNPIINRLVSSGVLQLRSTVIGPSRVYVNVTVPSSINSIAQKLESVTIAYKTRNLLSYINSTRILTGILGGVTSKIYDTTDIMSTSWTTYTVTDLTPDPIVGSVLVKLEVQHGGIGYDYDIEIGTITITLTD